MKKIAFLTTGGTIASRPTGNGLTPQLSSEDLLEQLPQIGQYCQIAAHPLFSLDSTNVCPSHWQQMARSICKYLPETDGIVLSHGTDTMAYTAAALYTMLPGLNKPVVLTGSQLPLEKEGTDAIRNLKDAFHVCACGMFPGVSIVFGGEIISGFCASKVHTTSFQGFASINYPVAGTIHNGTIQPNKEFHAPKTSSGCIGQLIDKFDPHVFLLKLLPGMDGRILDILMEQGYKGIVIEAFGSGGIPCFDDSFLKGIRHCTDRQIPIVVTTQCHHGEANLRIYQVGTQAAAAGAICGGNMTSEMLVVRLMWALGQSNDLSRIRELIFLDFENSL